MAQDRQITLQDQTTQRETKKNQMDASDRIVYKQTKQQKQKTTETKSRRDSRERGGGREEKEFVEERKEKKTIDSGPIAQTDVLVLS
jgi:hypothetical protein